MTGPAASLACVSRSDVGCVRQRNEDALAMVPERGWLVLADGMGGYLGGDVAARMGVDLVMQRLEEGAGEIGGAEDAARLLVQGVELANAEIHREGLERADLMGMGSTVVAVVFVGDHLVCAHVGDSRLYRFDADGLVCLTRDHTMLQEQVDAGVVSAEDARHAPYRGMLTRGLGVLPWVDVEIGIHEVRPGDAYLLCSDGLTDMLDDGDIAAEFGAAASLDAIADRLVALANARGGRDNISLILARVAG